MFLSECAYCCKRNFCNKYFACLGALVVCIALIIYLPIIMAESPVSEMAEFANTAFASQMFNILKKTPGNVFFSPYSLQVALAMVYSGASGNTAKQLQKSLSFSEDKAALYKAVKASAAVVKSTKNVTLNIANGMFLQRDFVVKETFVKNMKSVFVAEAKGVNFAEKEAAAKEINTFVNKNTNGKIQELFKADAFDDLTKLVLVNAIYFKGSWVNKFDPANTFQGDFFLNSKDKIKVDFMTITKKFNTGENEALKAHIVELPYEDDLSMVLIVPKEIEGIKHVEKTLPKMNLKSITNGTTSAEVHLTMPKFKLEQKLDLVDSLKEMGIVDMFDSQKAEFGEISDRKDLYVSKVVQKSYIEVNEEGSEAAAATGIKFTMRMMPLPPQEVHVRGPFMFLIIHSKGPVLFAGRVSKL